MNGWEWAAIAFGTWCALSVPAGILTGRWLRAETPAPGDTRVPAPHPVPGTTVPAVPQAAEPPSRQSPAPGCRWCEDTGWAELIDPWFGDAFYVACPGGCLPTLPARETP